MKEQAERCDALLAVIGKSWIDARDGSGTRRLDNPDDFVRTEIETALKHGKTVIPVLVGDAHMPRPEELPEPIRALAGRNAWRLTHERFRADAQGLIKALQRTLEEAEGRRQEAITIIASTQAVAIISGTAGKPDLRFIAASLIANDLFGIDLGDGKGPLLVGRTMEQFLSALKKRMHPAQWRAFDRDQNEARSKLSLRADQ
jgi:hypothetical protein